MRDTIEIVAAISLPHHHLVLVWSVGFAQPTHYTGAKQCFANFLFRRRVAPRSHIAVSLSTAQKFD